MTKYVDVDALLERLPNDLPYKASVKRVLMQAEGVEVKHGEWRRGTEPNGSVYAHCSACNRKMNSCCYGYAHCPLCGARMDGKDTNVPTK